VRVEQRCPAFTPWSDPPINPRAQCGLPAGHTGHHSLLTPTGVTWAEEPMPRPAARTARPRDAATHARYAGWTQSDLVDQLAEANDEIARLTKITDPDRVPLRLVVVPSSTIPGVLSLRPVGADGEATGHLKHELRDAGFHPGDVVEVVLVRRGLTSVAGDAW